MPRYITTVNATSNTSANTEDLFLEISGYVKVFLVRVRLGDGTATAGVDNDYRVRLINCTGTTGGSSITPTCNPMDFMGRAKAATLKAKNGTTALALGAGAVTIDQIVKNGRETFEYIARDDESVITTHVTTASGGVFGVVIQSPAVSQKFQVTVIHEE